MSTDPESLAAAFDAIQVGNTGRPCAFRAWVDTLDPVTAATVWANVYGTKPYRKVASAISANGYRVSGTTINNHRNHGCLACLSKPI